MRWWKWPISIANSATTFSITTAGITTLRINTSILGLILTLSINDIQHNATWYWESLCWMSLCWVSRLLKCHPECRYAKCHYAECRYSACHYAECRGALQTVNITGYVIISPKWFKVMAVIWIWNERSYQSNLTMKRNNTFCSVLFMEIFIILILDILWWNQRGSFIH